MNTSFTSSDAETPFVIKLGFQKLYEFMDKAIEENENPLITSLTKQMLQGLKYRDELTNGIKLDEIAKYHDEIQMLLCLLFPHALSDNEIKVAVPPISSELLYSSRRFTAIFGDDNLLEAKEFEDFNDDRVYITMCTFILGKYYKISQNIGRPPVYDVVSSTGITRHYKSVYNADFIEILPLVEPPEMTKELIKKLKDNFDDIDLWKSVFPPNSWELKGFGMRSFINVSGEEALSRLKDLMIQQRIFDNQAEFEVQLNNRIRSIFDIPDLWATFTMYDADRGLFRKPADNKKSIALNSLHECTRQDLMCSVSSKSIFEEKSSFVIANSELLPQEAQQHKMYENIVQQGVKSYIMTPLYDEDRLMGIIEFASYTKDALNQASLSHVSELVHISSNVIKAYLNEYATKLTAIIQTEYTAIHPSVAWKFREEAESIIENQIRNEKYKSEPIIFNELTALYGQTDIAHSSLTRNKAISEDLKNQINQVLDILQMLNVKVEMPLIESIIYQTNIIKEKLDSDLAAGMEIQVTDFLVAHINPLFKRMQHRDQELGGMIKAYFDAIPTGMDIIYDKRKGFDTTVEMINARMAKKIDKAQQTAQKIYPHYFERYKTDGVEHNMFIGASIAPQLPFDKLYLDNLRLWQLKTMCELEIDHHHQKPNLPLPMEVASLIMVYSNHLAIRYRLDEKQFDVDGAYNARYEIIKKRIDKAHIKGTNDRITIPGHIVIVYTQPSDLDEYLGFANFLSYQGLIKGEPEQFDIENLQGVAGLKGLRVAVNYEHQPESQTVSSPKAEKALLN